MDNLYKRLARAEAMANAARDEKIEVLISRYEKACQEQNEEDAASYARKIRNKLLEGSDYAACIDRLGLEAPEGSTFSAWKPFLEELAGALSNKWMEYRQELRDIPEQEGFPFNIIFPKSPDDPEDEEE